MNRSRLTSSVCALATAFLCAASAQEQLVITTKSLPIASSGIPYSAALSASGGTAPYTWSVRTGKLPSGLTLNSMNGAISGTPSALNAPTGRSKTQTFFPFPLIFQVQDANGLTGTRNLPIQVANPIVILTTSLPAGTVGVSYSFCLTATGGALAYNGGFWSIAGRFLPPGIVLTRSRGCQGLLSGSPSKAGKFPVQVRVADFQGRSAHASFILIVAKEARHLR